MTSATSEQVLAATRSIKQDWKAIASLLLAILTFVTGVVWMISGHILKAAALDVETSAKKIIAIESKQALTDQMVLSQSKRLDDVLAEVRSVSLKINSVAESQARMEGVLMGSKK